MSKVRCYECKKTYDYNEDGFCPRCGCFNQPPSARRIDANGNIVYADGINEQNHEGSFVHREYHAENARRRFTPLEKSAVRPLEKSAVRPQKKSSAARAKRTVEGDPQNLSKLLVFFIFAMFFLLKLTLEILS